MNAFRTRRRRLLLALALLLLLGIAGGTWSALRSAAQVAKVEELGKQLREAGRNLPADQRRERWQEFRQEMDKLTPEQRRQVGAKISEERRRTLRAKLQQYFAMSRKEQQAFLDGEINRMEARRRQRERDRAQGGTNAAGAGGPGNRGNWSKLSPAERDRMRQQRIDSSTPEDRAMTSEFFKQLNERRQQRGLPVRTGRG